ncbi:MAG TPA: phage tail tube protein [Conexibacter sp.]|nr:phage tail tube protein [Conexibacter sp.]
MGIPSGLGAQLGIATESTYGTYVAPTTFLKPTSESLQRTNNYVRTFGLGGGSLVQDASLHAQTTRTASGGIVLDVLDKGFGKLLNMLHGNVVTPAALTGGLFRQTHNIGLSAPTGKSLTVQVGRPDVGGTVQPFSYLGCKVTQLAFTLDLNGVVSVNVALDARDETTAQTLATATYATNAVPFNFTNASIEFDDVVLTDCVTSATITIPLPQKADRFGIGGGAVKKEPVVNAPLAATIALNLEFANLNQQTAFASNANRKLELNCTGSTTSGTYASALNFTAAATKTTDAGPVVAGPDVLMQQVLLEVVNTGSGTPLVIDYVGGDSAV